MITDFLKRISAKDIVKSLIVVGALLAIAYMSYSLRSSTLDSPTVLDYDPWWFFRHAQEFLDNGFSFPQWDELSYYPPGRPIEKFQGWPVSMAIMYTATQTFSSMSFVDFAKLSPIIMVLLSILPAYFLGKNLSNRWGGILTALFIVLAPTYIAVSMGGYCDSDVVVSLYSVLLVMSVFLALKKRTISYIALAILVNTMFIYSWARGWYILLFFAAFMPVLLVFRVIQEIIVERKFKINLSAILAEAKQLFVPLIVIIVVCNIIGLIFGLSDFYNTIIGGYQFMTGQKLIVNLSVAELQTLDIFSQSGFNEIVNRVGLGPMALSFGIWPLPILTSPLLLLMIYKVYKKQKINFIEVFLLLWAIVTFYLITRGVRFSIMFSIASSAAAGYVVGNLMALLKKKVFQATLFGVVVILVLMFVNDATTASNQAAGMEISQNWYDMLDWLKANADSKALVATWWDPGHIITGYTGLRVHADGAHCPPGSCVPYNHDIRIQDMGRLMATSSENESISILKKYNGLDAATCQAANEAVQKKWGVSIPSGDCDPPSEIYVIASSDLIGKYYWMSYYGLGQGRNYNYMNFDSYDQTQGVISYSGGLLSLVRQNSMWVPVINSPDQGVRNMVVKNIIYFENGQEKRYTLNDTSAIDGMVWVDSGYSVAIYMDTTIQNSVFTKMFFFGGEGLEHYKLVYQNAEIKLFKVSF